MTASTSLLAYQDMIKLMEAAHENKKGIRVRYIDENTASNARMRFNKARVLDREANIEIYDKGHKLYGRSIYDDLFATIDVDEEGVWLRLERRTIETLEIQPLGEDNEQQRPAQSDGGEVQGTPSERGDQDPIEEAFAPETPEASSSRRF